MKISFLCPPVGMFGGIRVIGIYAEQLRRLGHDVQIYSVLGRRPTLKARLKGLLRGQPPGTGDRARPSFLDGMGVDHVRLAHSAPITAADLPPADVVVATWWETAHWAMRLPPSKGARAYFMQDYGAPGQELEKIVPTWRLPLYKITIAEWLKELIRRHVPGEEVAVVHNSVDLEVFRAPPRSKQAVPTVGFVWRSGKTKGAELALAAVAEARRTCPDLRCVAFGDRAEAGEAAAGIEFHHRPDDATVATLYAACDAWLFPSSIEGFGLPILEAMACRTPVISTPVGAAPEFVTPDRGWLLPDFAPETMARAILEAAGLAEAEWRARSDAVRPAVEAYTWTDAARRFEAALEVAVMRAGTVSPAG